MEKRKLIIGTYDTARDGPWTLSALSFPEPEYQANMVEIPGRDGLLDLSTVLTNGEPRYGNRTLEATLECSDGTRADRTKQISAIINQLDGRRLQIVLPDDPTRYIEGRVRVETKYNDPAHAAVAVSAVCDPWRYNHHETVLRIDGTEAGALTVLTNGGRRTVTPSVTISGDDASVVLSDGDYTWELTAGVYTLVDLVLTAGCRVPITCKGKGTAAFTYREAVL